MSALLHLTAAVIALGAPAWDRFEAGRLRPGTGPRARTQCYVRCIAVPWIAACAAAALLPFDVLWNAPQAARDLIGRPSPVFLMTFIPALGAGFLLPVLAAFVHSGTRRRILGQLDMVDYLLPRTGAEIAWFAGVSVSAGICEEVLYRGFFLPYLMAAPWNLGPGAALLLTAALFGFAHNGQGAKAMLMTGTVGLFLGALYVITGNLLLPIVVHALIGLRAAAFAWMRRWPQPAAG